MSFIGDVLGAVAGPLIGGLFGGSDSNSGGGQATQQQRQVYDPYGPYRGAAAQKLNALMADPSSVQGLPEWGAMQQAAARTMAAQGYTGSGNALVAAANAGGQAYQQAFNNLAMLSGAGQSPAWAANAANSQAAYQQGMQNQMWGTLGNSIGQWFGGQPGSQAGGYSGGGYGNVPAYPGPSGGGGYGGGYNISAGGSGGKYSTSPG